LEAKKSGFSPQVNFPEDKGNILSILFKSGKYFLNYRENFPSVKLFINGRVKILFPDNGEKFPY
jgi:hypothetical protein